MKNIGISDIDAILEKGRELQQFLSEAPEVLEFLRLAESGGRIPPVMVVQQDRYIRVGEAAKILGVDKGTIYRYKREGRLTAYRVENDGQMKFRMSEVWALPQKVEEGAA